MDHHSTLLNTVTMDHMNFETVIGLEMHIQLNTHSKIFSADANAFGDEPNTHTSVVSLAHPGTLPVINREVIEKAIKLALAIGAEINLENRFDRKHYFYPDLPKAYQITQDKLPICSGGHIRIPSGDHTRVIRIHHIHMEEDAGKSMHLANSNSSFVDLNRAGVPLLEMVTEPDFRSGEEVHAFIEKLQQMVRYLGISDAHMEAGSLRCDCNVSVRPKGQQELGERCEIKNLNSKKFALKAVQAEAERQIKLIREGGQIEQTTLHFDSHTNKTFPTREKESAMDYRYFPDPDLPPILITQEEIDNVEQQMPALPDEVMRHLKEEFALTDYQSKLISREREYYIYFLSLASKYPKHASISNIIINKIIPYCKEHEIGIDQLDLPMNHVIDFLELIESKKVVASIAYQVLFPKMMESKGQHPHDLAIELEVLQSTESTDAIDSMIAEILENSPVEVKKYHQGKKAIIGFFIGRVMKKTKGSMHPGQVKEKILKALDALGS